MIVIQTKLVIANQTSNWAAKFSLNLASSIIWQLHYIILLVTASKICSKDLEL